MMRKIFLHTGIGEVVYTKRAQSRTIKISVSRSRGIRVSLPLYTSYAKAVEFVEANLERIGELLQKPERVKVPRASNAEFPLSEASSPLDLALTRKRAHEVLPVRLADISARLNATILVRNKLGIRRDKPFSYNRLAIKNNRTNWGSCSSVRNINLNMHLVNLPPELMDFVIIHELCHLIYPNHGPRFHELVNTACNGREKELSRTLKAYRPG